MAPFSRNVIYLVVTLKLDNVNPFWWEVPPNLGKEVPVAKANEKFKALVHLMVHTCKNDTARLGSIRLNKALWFVDLIAYQKRGQPVTCEKYVKRKKGPVPKRILATLRELETDGAIRIQEPKHTYDTRKYTSLTEPNLDPLGEDDRILAVNVLTSVLGHTADEISELTHEEIWKAAAEGEEIPLCATLVSGQGQITNAVRKWANEEVLKLEGAPA